MKPSISELITQIEEEGRALHPLQKHIIQNALKNLQRAFSATNEFTSYDDTKLLLWEYAISSAEHEILAFATNRKDKSGYGFSPDPKLLETQASAINKGVKIYRIFAVSQSDYQQFAFMELLRAQIKAGITILVAHANAAEYINSEQEKDQENYIIIDNKLLYRSYVVGEESRNSISFDPQNIQKYRGMFEELRGGLEQFKLEDLPKAFNEL